MLDTILNHTSIRKFKPNLIPDFDLKEILSCGLRASSSGNMQTWSVIVTTNNDLRQKLCQHHNDQKMIMEAPYILTFCADFYRMRRWMELEGAENSFDDLTGFMYAAIDAVLAAQNIAIASESKGLGICYLGTTLWAADQISETLQLPDFVVPITSMVIGYPDESPALVERLPLEFTAHQETYQIPTNEEVLNFYKSKSEKRWNLYLENTKLKKNIEEGNIKNLAQYYSSKYKYGKEIHSKSSKMYLDLLKKKGFWNF